VFQRVSQTRHGFVILTTLHIDLGLADQGTLTKRVADPCRALIENKRLGQFALETVQIAEFQ
jgi:hypothetical protein